MALLAGLPMMRDIGAQTTPHATAGLSSGEAAERLARDGVNVLPQPAPIRLWQRVFGQLRDPLIVVLLLAAGLTAVTADWTDMALILAVVVVNSPNQRYPLGTSWHRNRLHQILPMSSMISIAVERSGRPRPTSQPNSGQSRPPSALSFRAAVCRANTVYR